MIRATALRQFLLKRVAYWMGMALAVMTTDNITLAGSNIINGRIETILIAQENTGTHTVNLNIKDGSVIGAANNKQTIYASASAQGAGSATQNLNLSVADSTIYSDIRALSASENSAGTTTNVNMNVCPLLLGR